LNANLGRFTVKTMGAFPFGSWAGAEETGASGKPKVFLSLSGHESKAWGEKQKPYQKV
jgi:hypothetical protein